MNQMPGDVGTAQDTNKDQAPGAPNRAAGNKEVAGGSRHRDMSRNERNLVVAIGVFVALGLAGAGIFVAATHQTREPELLLPLLLTLGVVLLIASLAALGVILHGSGLSDGTQALGLPEGSVRAVLALALVLVFAILSVFLFLQLQIPSTVVSKGLTVDQLSLLPPGQVVQIDPEPSTSPQLFTVFVLPANPAAAQVAQQLVTVLATLVTAVAAFYFGASTVKDAGAAAAQLITLKGTPPPAADGDTPKGAGNTQPDGETPKGAGNTQPDGETPKGPGNTQPDGETPKGAGSAKDA